MYNCPNLPAITIRGIHITAKLHKKLDNLIVASTDGVVQRGDALIVGGAGIRYLHSTGDNRGYFQALHMQG